MEEKVTDMEEKATGGRREQKKVTRNRRVQKKEEEEREEDILKMLERSGWRIIDEIEKEEKNTSKKEEKNKKEEESEEEKKGGMRKQFEKGMVQETQETKIHKRKEQEIHKRKDQEKTQEKRIQQEVQRKEEHLKKNLKTQQEEQREEENIMKQKKKTQNKEEDRKEGTVKKDNEKNREYKGSREYEEEGEEISKIKIEEESGYDYILMSKEIEEKIKIEEKGGYDNIPIDNELEEKGDEEESWEDITGDITMDTTEEVAGYTTEEEEDTRGEEMKGRKNKEKEENIIGDIENHTTEEKDAGDIKNHTKEEKDARDEGKTRDKKEEKWEDWIEGMEEKMESSWESSWETIITGGTSENMDSSSCETIRSSWETIITERNRVIQEKRGNKYEITRTLNNRWDIPYTRENEREKEETKDMDTTKEKTKDMDTTNEEIKEAHITYTRTNKETNEETKDTHIPNTRESEEMKEIQTIERREITVMTDKTEAIEEIKEIGGKRRKILEEEKEKDIILEIEIDDTTDEEEKREKEIIILISDEEERTEENERNKDQKETKWKKTKKIVEVEGGFKNLVERKIDIPENVSTILSLGEKFIIPYKNTEVGQIIQMVRDAERIWQESSWNDKARSFGKWKSEIIKTAIRERKDMSKEEDRIVQMILELEEFMIKNKDITIEHTDKGKKTIIIEKERKKKMERLFMEEAQNKGMYRMEKIAEKTERMVMGNKEMAKLRRKIADWKKKGIFKERNERNIGREKEMWDIMVRVETEIPEMKFTIKAHKKDIGIRNICPKNRTWTYGLSRVIDGIIRKGLEKNLKKMGYIDRNIKDIVKWAQEIEGEKIEEDEIMVTVDVKEMFNMIETDRLINMVRRNISWEEYNEEVITEMMEYDLKEANYVEHEGRIYKQIKGIPMGAPSSCAYADTYLNIHIMLYEEKMERSGIRRMGKYIDDIFFIAKKGKWENILKEIEKDAGMEMKSETEEEKGEVEFLDIKLKRIEGEIEIERNKKEYMSARHIHRMSGHKDTQKRETLISTMQRTMDLTSIRKVKEKIQNDIREFEMNGYDLRYIERIMDEVIRRGEDRKRKWGWRDMLGEVGSRNIRREEKREIVRICRNELKKKREEEHKKREEEHKEKEKEKWGGEETRLRKITGTNEKEVTGREEKEQRGEQNMRGEQSTTRRSKIEEKIEEELKKEEKVKVKRGRIGQKKRIGPRIPFIRTPYRKDIEKEIGMKIKKLTKDRIRQINVIRRDKRMERITKNIGRKQEEGRNRREK